MTHSPPHLPGYRAKAALHPSAYGALKAAYKYSGKCLKSLAFTLAALIWIIPGGPVWAEAGETPKEPLEIVALGDSLTAGYQLPPGKGFAEQLGKELAEKGYNVGVMNAGVSGDTSSGGLARLDWAVGPETDAVILELGSNDALRGIDPELTRQNLAAIIEELQSRGIAVLLAGMLAPPNMGADYERAFNPIYPGLAEEYGVLLYPFFLDGVAAEPALNLGDGMHPNEEGIEVMVERIFPTVEKLIARVREKAAPASETAKEITHKDGEG